MSRPAAYLPVLVVAAAALWAGLSLNRAVAPSPISDPAAVSQLMVLRLADASGVVQPMAQWKGRIIVVNFWATWCPPCREEMPGFERLSRKFAAKGVQFVGISIDSVEKVRSFAAEAGITYPLLIGDAAAFDLVRGLGNPSQGLPFTIILDRTGAPLRLKLGRMSEDDLSDFLTRASAG